MPFKCYRGPVEEKVLERIRPSQEERKLAEKIWREVRDVLTRYFERQGLDVEVTLQGSVAKDTWLSGDLDIDVFVLFPPDWENKLDKAKEMFKEAFRGYVVEERYAAHPYIRVLVENVWVDVVPALKVPSGSEAKTATDRTPFHTRYVCEKLTPEQRDEVRLLKKFMKGIGVYGAEIAVQGFSGYLVELLIAAFGCFRSVLEKAAEWKPPVVIDLENHYGGVVHRVIDRFKDQPLIVIDPVDPRRNVAAAVSTKSFATFILASRLYLENPSECFFEPPPYPHDHSKVLEALGSRASRVVLLSFRLPGYAPDVAWGIARRVLRRVRSFLEQSKYPVLRGDVTYDEEESRVYIIVELGYETMPNPLLHEGPFAWDRLDRVLKFVRKYVSSSVGPWVGEDGKLYVLRNYPELNLEQLTKLLPEESRDVIVTRIDEEVVKPLPIHVRRWLYRFAVGRAEWLQCVSS